MKVIWLSDLHLNQISEVQRYGFLDRLYRAKGDVVVVTGDISDGVNLTHHLGELSEACSFKEIYFVLGNHDFYCSSIQRVRAEVASLCRKRKNLHHLGHGEIVPLSSNTALIGHDGWSDGRAGNGSRSRLKNPDFWSIAEFRSKNWTDCYHLMGTLGRESERYAQKVLPRAMKSYDNIVVATHVPPFSQATWWNNKRCNYDYQPHYTNMSLGYSLWDHSIKMPTSSITVLCGHTHSKVSLSLRPNLRVQTAEVHSGNPRYDQLET